MATLTAPCPQGASDEQLLACFAAGHRHALDELFRRYRQPAYRVAYRLLGHEADALDAVQEGFIKALTHLHGFQGRSSFKTWLLRVVSNAALDLGRQRSRRDAVSLDDRTAGTFLTRTCSLLMRLDADSNATICDTNWIRPWIVCRTCNGRRLCSSLTVN